ncbi:MAG TPA: leucine zipper domain-containing protein [Jiangellaceae bacterium]|nr:leucine zipper domain-containing protein [Jiangellaceae bacterium]
MTHRKAPLTVLGRQRAVDQVIKAGRPIAHVAAEFRIARATLSKRVSRYRDHGVVGLEDRSSAPAVRPSRCPTIVISAVVVPGPVSVLVMGAIPPAPHRRIAAALWRVGSRPALKPRRSVASASSSEG